MTEKANCILSQFSFVLHFGSSLWVHRSRRYDVDKIQDSNKNLTLLLIAYSQWKYVFMTRELDLLRSVQSCGFSALTNTIWVESASFQQHVTHTAYIVTRTSPSIHENTDNLSIITPCSWSNYYWTLYACGECAPFSYFNASFWSLRPEVRLALADNYYLRELEFRNLHKGFVFKKRDVLKSSGLSNLKCKTKTRRWLCFTFILSGQRGTSCLRPNSLTFVDTKALKSSWSHRMCALLIYWSLVFCKSQNKVLFCQ